MAILDRAFAAISPPVTDEKRAEAHARAREAAEPGDWLSLVLDQHEGIDAAFAAVKAAATVEDRRKAEKMLGTLLTGHSMAEEAVIYPALAQTGEQGHANTAYSEQAATKMQMAALEVMEAMSQDYLDKLGHLEGAVKTHMFQEESDWFVAMKENAPADAQSRATARYRDEYARYIDGDAPQRSAAGHQPPV